MKTFSSIAALAAVLAAAVPHTASAQTSPLPYRIYGDTVVAFACVERTVFNPGDTIVFRAEVDDASGAKVTADQIKARGLHVAIALADGTNLPMTFTIHPPFPNAPKTDYYWAVAWKTKPDHPTGTLPWTLTVTDSSGAVVTWQPIGQKVGASILTLAEKPASAPPKT